MRLHVAERPEPPADLALPEDAENPRVVMWQHYGVEGEYPNSIYHSDRITATLTSGEIPEGFHAPQEPFHAELGGDLRTEYIKTKDLRTKPEAAEKR